LESPGREHHQRILKRDRLLLVRRTCKRAQKKATQNTRGLFDGKTGEGRHKDNPECAVRIFVIGSDEVNDNVQSNRLTIRLTGANPTG
ncbi:MAG TPA: hypothetical protein VLG39_08945, partial [Nitrospirota bacterium]|nr:hypothetical protein [Nitrospirota bacterium]